MNTMVIALTATGCNTPVETIYTPVSTTSVTTTTASTTETTTTTTSDPTSTTTASEPIETTDNVPKEDINAIIAKATNNINKNTTKPVDNSIWDEPAETTKPAATTTVDNSIWDEPIETTKPVETATITVNGAIDNIKKICGLKSDVETDITICVVDVYDEHNPYDVVYNYDVNYNAFVKACDWSLVFDADYYMEQFPMLAAQYHNDKALLLEHFQTLGIHEGRQGSASFNVGAYKANCDSKISNTFGDNYEGYYFYYMLNNNSEKSVTTTGNYKNQYKQILTACQDAELEGVNGYRAEVGAKAYPFNSELAAFAAYRGYINAHDGYRHHDWFVDEANYDFLWSIVTRNNGNNLAENTWYNTYAYNVSGNTTYAEYRKSEKHYKQMISTRYDIFGSSNIYHSGKDHYATQFQTFLDL